MVFARIVALQVIIIMAIYIINCQDYSYSDYSLMDLSKWDYCDGAAWEQDDNNRYKNTSSWTSGDVVCPNSRCIYGLVEGPGKIVFAWKKNLNSSPMLNDFTNFSFYINNKLYASCDKSIWRELSFPINKSGDNEVKWVFELDKSDNLGRCPSGSHGTGWLSAIKYYFNNSTLPERNTPPTKPFVSGVVTGDNRTLYDFQATSIDPDGDRLKYLFDWGDGTSTETDYIISGKTANKSHIWAYGGNYNVNIIAIDSHQESSDSAKMTSKIASLIDVAPKVILQDIMNNISDNTVIILKGSRYCGPFTILKNNITIKSSESVRSIIDGIGEKYTIGIDNANNIILENIELVNSTSGIIIQDSNNCLIRNSNIFFGNGSGIYIDGGINNTILSNIIRAIGDDASDGIKILNSNLNYIYENDIILDNYIYYLENSRDNTIFFKGSNCGPVFCNGCECQIQSCSISSCHYMNCRIRGDCDCEIDESNRWGCAI